MKKFAPLLLLLVAIAWQLKAQGTLLDAQFTHGDSLRTYKLYVPAAYDGSEAWPLVLVLHGFTLDPDFMIALTGMNAVADTGHFLVAYPQGLLVHQLGDLIPPFPEYGPGWNSGGELVSDNDDAGFLSRMIHKIGLSHKVDPARVYTCGLSNGGHMSYRLACELSDRIAAVVSVSGAMPTDVPCSNGRPIPLMEIHGTADPIVSYDGIPPYHFSIPDGIAFWVNHNQCEAAPVVNNFPDTDPTDGTTVTLKKYGNCDADASVWLMDVVGGGHVWPTSYLPPPPFIGPVNNDVHGSSEIWNFFKKHTHPDPVLTQFPWHAPVVPNPFGTNLPGTFRLRLADFDNDGVKEATMFFTNGDLRYFENAGTDAVPNFQYVQLFPFGFPQLTNPIRMPYRYVDIDGDCDLDAFLFRIFLGPFEQLEFLENKGTPDAPWFGDSQLQANPFGFVAPTSDSVAGVGLQNVFYSFVDIDADNDQDLFLGGNFPASVSPSLDENLYFYRNDDPSGKGTSPHFTGPIKNPFGLSRPILIPNVIVVPNFVDMDCDGDWDMFATYAGVAITFIENTGSPGAPDFGSEPVVWMANDPPQPPGFDSYEFGDWLDIGGDGDLDFITPAIFLENTSNGTMACQVPKAACNMTARVQFIHAADHETVRLVANGETLRETFAYQTATPFMEVPAGVPLDVDVVVKDPWSSHPDEQFPLYFTPNRTYVVVLHGTFDPSDPYPVAFSMFEGGRQEGTQSDKVDMLLFRGGPDITGPVDIVVVGGPVLADNVLTGDFGEDYVSLPAGSFVFSPTPPDNNDIILDPFQAHMGFWKGRSAVIFGTGLVNAGTLQPWVALSNGGTFPLFPPPGQKMKPGAGGKNLAGSLRVAPNPASREAQVLLTVSEAGSNTLELFNANGVKMMEMDLGDLPMGYLPVDLDLSGLAEGVYFLKYRNGRELATVRLAVIRK
ncbi:MAG: T9SS type A sorting domain-containing protein [Bacteroidetes bacterium]|nr:T9SS type A sorting domain-containing protein [Bacteroidota bacterium]